MQGLILAHLCILFFFSARAVSSSKFWPVPRADAVPDMRIATYNLRYDSQPDSITVQQSLANLPDPLVAINYYGKSSEQPWSSRRIKVAQHLLSEGVVIASMHMCTLRLDHTLIPR